MKNIEDNINYETLKKLKDEELVFISKNGNILAEEILIYRYKNTAKIKSHAYFLKGADEEDLIQEGMIGIYEAIRSFDESKNVSFNTFVNVCIERKLINLLKKDNTKKNTFLNDSFSLNEDSYENEGEVSNIASKFIVSENNNPINLIIEKERDKEYNKEVELKLSNFELDVLNEYLKGKSYEEISNYLSIDIKSIDNALQRLKKKLKK